MAMLLGLALLCPLLEAVPVSKHRVHGPWSNLAHHMPGSPDQPEITFTASGSIGLSWGDMEEPVDKYSLEMSATGEHKGFHQIYMGPPANYTAENLKSGVTYYFRLSAHNPWGWGPSSDIADATTTRESTPEEPATPMMLTAKVTKASEVVLEWRKPADTEGSDIPIYVVQYRQASNSSSDSEGWTETYFGHQTWCTVVGLQPNTDYQFRVALRSDAGVFHFGLPDQVHTFDPLLPGPPHHLTADKVAHTASKLALTWKAADYTGEAPVTSYRVLGGDCRQPGSKWSSLYEGPQTSVVVHTLEASTQYCFQVQAKNSAGWSIPSASTAASTPSATTPGALPPPFATENTQSQITVAWRAPTDMDTGGEAVDRYRLEMSEEGDQLLKGAGKVLNVEARDSSFRHIFEGHELRFTKEDLSPNRVYQFRVLAHNKHGWGAKSGVTTVRTPKNGFDKAAERKRMLEQLTEEGPAMVEM